MITSKRAVRGSKQKSRSASRVQLLDVPARAPVEGLLDSENEFLPLLQKLAQSRFLAFGAGAAPAIASATAVVCHDTYGLTGCHRQQ